VPQLRVAGDGVEIAVHDLGGRGRPVFLVHAAGLHGLVWRPLAAHLSRYYHCVALDLRSHGDSDAALDGDLHWRNFARDVTAVVTGLGLRRPLGVGHSSGATALLLAEQDAPGTFSALYCFEPVVVPADPPLGPDPDNWLAAAARRRRSIFPSPQLALSHFASTPPLASLHPDALEAYVEHGFAEAPGKGVVLKCSPEHEARMLEMATAHDCYVRLEGVSCPVMLAWGTASDAYGEAAAGHLLTRLPHACPEAVGGVGHLGPLEDPERVAASAARFFDAMDTARF
jgi:pimeloyl-ACP methyl ester carboxylesterase